MATGKLILQIVIISVFLLGVIILSSIVLYHLNNSTCNNDNNIKIARTYMAWVVGISVTLFALLMILLIVIIKLKV